MKKLLLTALTFLLFAGTAGAGTTAGGSGNHRQIKGGEGNHRIITLTNGDIGNH